MAISIDWANKIINVPKSDTNVIQLVPTEIRELDLNWFRLQLKNLEALEEGIVNEKTHNHNTEVTLGGLTFARVLNIINGYTITFEDGQWAVNLQGANSNVGDVVNVNQVSVRSFNSAGMVISGSLDPSEIAAEVWGSIVGSSLSAKEIINIMASALAGTVSGSGEGARTVTFRDLANTKDVIIADVDGQGNRTSIAVDGT